MREIQYELCDFPTPQIRDARWPEIFWRFFTQIGSRAMPRLAWFRFYREGTTKTYQLLDEHYGVDDLLRFVPTLIWGESKDYFLLISSFLLAWMCGGCTNVVGLIKLVKVTKYNFIFFCVLHFYNITYSIEEVVLLKKCPKPHQLY